MNERLMEIIRLKACGRLKNFADLMGWSPQYVQKLVRGISFGLQPVLAILDKFPDINARWFLFGKGSMLNDDAISMIHQQVLVNIQDLVHLDKYIAVMNANEIKSLQQAIEKGTQPILSPETVCELEKRIK